MTRPLDREDLRLAVYRGFAADGRAPGPGALAEQLHVDQATVTDSLIATNTNPARAEAADCTSFVGTVSDGGSASNSRATTGGSSALAISLEATPASSARAFRSTFSSSTTAPAAGDGAVRLRSTTGA